MEQTNFYGLSKPTQNAGDIDAGDIDAGDIDVGDRVIMFPTFSVMLVIFSIY